jgi:adenylylsulfate kinase
VSGPPLLDGTVVWFTGLPSSGKSTLARRVSERLRSAGREPVLLDGDAVRAALVPAPGYDAAGRDAFYATLARLAAALARDGHLVLVAATASHHAHRAAARALAPRFVEVWLDVPADECARRDPKGLWARARAGEAPHLPGAGEPYETPERPDVAARGGEDDAAVEEILRQLGRSWRGPVSTAARRPGSRSRR